MARDIDTNFYSSFPYVRTIGQIDGGAVRYRLFDGHMRHLFCGAGRFGTADRGEAVRFDYKRYAQVWTRSTSHH